MDFLVFFQVNRRGFFQDHLSKPSPFNERSKVRFIEISHIYMSDFNLKKNSKQESIVKLNVKHLFKIIFLKIC